MRKPDEIKREILEKVEEYYKSAYPETPFEPGKTKIDNSGPLRNAEEFKSLVESALSGRWTQGKYAQEFEKKISDYISTNHAIFVNSGSSANLIALSTLTSSTIGDKRIKRGDEVISVAAAFPTTVNPIVQLGAIPVFLDIEPLETGRYNIDCSRLEDAISEKTKAIFLAHTLGNPFNLEKILEIKEKYNLWLIEDCCDALGSKYKEKNVGTYGDLSTISFYPAHHITTGEGGAVLTNNGKLWRIAHTFRNWGRDCWCPPAKDNSCGKRFGWQFGTLPFGYDHKNAYTEFGYNLKGTELHAAVGLAQLSKAEDFEKRRQENFDYLYENLERYQDRIILPQHLPEAKPSWFGFPISIRKNAKFSREDLTSYLESHNIMIRPLFCGNITRQPSFQNNPDVEYRVVGNLENCDQTMYRTFWIGVQPNITNEKREYMAKVFDLFFNNPSHK